MFAEIITYQSSADLEKDLVEIKNVKRKFSPYIIEKNVENGIRSYDPSLARWNYERFGHQNPEEFFEHEKIQMETYLGERFGVTKRPAEFVVINDEIYSKDFPNQPFDVVLQRGIEYREQEGSTENEREKGELDGWIKIRKKLLDSKTPSGSKFIVVSGPGIKPNTMYPDNYVDIYESVMDFNEKKRIIQRKRFISGVSYEDYIQEIRAYDNKYFDNFNGPIDAWFLKKPIFLESGKELFADIFKENKSKTSLQEFEKILIECMPFIQTYINLLCNEEMDPEQILLAYNSVIYVADRSKEKNILVQQSLDIQTQIQYFGNIPTRNITTGCGISGGFNLSQNKLVNILFANSVASFGIDDESKYEKIIKCTHCPVCKKTVKAGIKDGYIHCLSCHASAPYGEAAA